MNRIGRVKRVQKAKIPNLLLLILDHNLKGLRIMIFFEKKKYKIVEFDLVECVVSKEVVEFKKKMIKIKTK